MERETVRLMCDAEGVEIIHIMLLTVPVHHAALVNRQR